jgi:hypothetical protein
MLLVVNVDVSLQHLEFLPLSVHICKMEFICLMCGLLCELLAFTSYSNYGNINKSQSLSVDWQLIVPSMTAVTILYTVKMAVLLSVM